MAPEPPFFQGNSNFTIMNLNKTSRTQVVNSVQDQANLTLETSNSLDLGATRLLYLSKKGMLGSQFQTININLHRHITDL